MKIVLFFFFCVCVLSKKEFPHYSQCDDKWGSDEMGVPGKEPEDDTICHQGCAMSSLSMALGGFGLTIYNETATPKNLNQWLRKNDGYHCMGGDCCNLVLDAVEKLDSERIKCLGEPKVPFLKTMRKLVQDGLIMLAHVRNQHHFVLITGVVEDKEDEFYINDPNYDIKTYKYSEIHDVIMYDII